MQKLLSLKKESQAIPAVNYHLWQPCCMKCKFCFARFEKSRENNLYKEEFVNRKNSLSIIKSAWKAGVTKISFAGGEPLLCPWLPELLAKAKQLGMTTMLISNGVLLSERWLNEHSINVDWCTLSIDSLIHTTNLKLGRAVKTKTISQEGYLQLCNMIKNHNIKLKINTTVTSSNYKENFIEFIREVSPKRWKVFQVLPVKGQNDIEFNNFKIDGEQFKEFVKKHNPIADDCIFVAEDNEAMRDSYLMIDPAGRFYDNVNGFYRFSDPIWKVGWNTAIKQISVSPDKFLKRGGLYNW